MKEMEGQLQRYKYMEVVFSKQRSSLKLKIPENEKTLEVVKFLKSKKEEEIKGTYELGNGLYANAKIKNPNSVCLWLGANVMLEYTFEEAIKLLDENISKADEKLKTTERDIEFVKDQITTLEVSMARVYNHNVRERRKKKIQENK